MKYLFLFIALLFVQTETMIGAPRTNYRNQSDQPDQQEKPPQLGDNERDAMLIVSGMGILTSVVSIFIDRYNMPHVKTQLFAALASLQQFVSYMVRSPLSKEQEEQIVEQLLAHLEELWPLEQK